VTQGTALFGLAAEHLAMAEGDGATQQQEQQQQQIQAKKG
jgi:hypothetical protein